MDSKTDKSFGSEGNPFTTGLKKLNYRLWLTISVLIVLVFLFLYGGNGIKHSLGLKKEVARIEARNDSLSKLNEWRKERIDRLKSGEARILEEEARKRKMAYPGEKIYVVNPDAK